MRVASTCRITELPRPRLVSRRSRSETASQRRLSARSAKTVPSATELSAMWSRALLIRVVTGSPNRSVTSVAGRSVRRTRTPPGARTRRPVGTATHTGGSGGGISPHNAAAEEPTSTPRVAKVAIHICVCSCHEAPATRNTQRPARISIPRSTSRSVCRAEIPTAGELIAGQHASLAARDPRPGAGVHPRKCAGSGRPSPRQLSTAARSGRLRHVIGGGISSHR